VRDVCRYSEELVRRQTSSTVETTTMDADDDDNDDDDNNVDDDDDDDAIESTDERAKEKIKLDRLLLRWPDVLLFKHAGRVRLLNRCTQSTAFMSFEWKRRMLSKFQRPTVYVSEAVS